MTKIRRPWALFVYDQYYPQGGLDDLHGTYETEEEAKEAKKHVRGEFREIHNLEELMSSTWQELWEEKA